MAPSSSYIMASVSRGCYQNLLQRQTYAHHRHNPSRLTMKTRIDPVLQWPCFFTLYLGSKSLNIQFGLYNEVMWPGALPRHVHVRMKVHMQES